VAGDGFAGSEREQHGLRLELIAGGNLINKTSSLNAKQSHLMFVA
jgi:hypothetical protein